LIRDGSKFDLDGLEELKEGEKVEVPIFPFPSLLVVCDGQVPDRKTSERRDPARIVHVEEVPIVGKDGEVKGVDLGEREERSDGGLRVDLVR